MLCSKGVCKYKTDNSGLCLKDKDNGFKPRKCDLHHCEENWQCKECRYGSVSCKENCYMYAWCTET